MQSRRHAYRSWSLTGRHVNYKKFCSNPHSTPLPILRIVLRLHLLPRRRNLWSRPLRLVTKLSPLCPLQPALFTLDLPNFEIALLSPFELALPSRDCLLHPLSPLSPCQFPLCLPLTPLSFSFLTLSLLEDRLFVHIQWDMHFFHAAEIGGQINVETAGYEGTSAIPPGEEMVAAAWTVGLW